MSVASQLTVDEAAGQPPWLTDDDLSWRPRREGLVLCASDHSTMSCLGSIPQRRGVGEPVVLQVAVVEPGFENLVGLDALLDRLRPAAATAGRPGTDEVEHRHRHVLGLLTAAGHGDNLGRLVPTSEAAALGTTRRISRESHTSALWIDEAARLVVDLAAVLGGVSRVVVDVDGLDLWDRPSLRVLHRAVILADDRLLVRGRLSHWAPQALPPSAGRAQDALDQLRHGFLAAVAAAPAATVHGPSAALPSAPASYPSVRELAAAAAAAGLDTLLRIVGDSLALQNFERARLLVDTAADLGVGDDGAVQLGRLSGIVWAQVGEMDRAVAELTSTVASARRPEDRAHLYYLLGLISTKRTYDPDAAREYYHRAQEAADEAVEDDSQVLVERAWAANGLALVAAMAGKSCTDEGQRRACFDEAYQLELSAFRMVRGQPGMSAFYLRYNLGYNLSFLLEITGRYRQAQEFLRSVSGALLAAQRSDYGALYLYAVGLLRLRDEDYAGSAQALQEAVSLAVSLRDPFYLERMLAALGYVEHRRGEYATACARYEEGLRLARWLRDAAAYAQQLAGVLWSIVLGRLPVPGQVVAATASWFPGVVEHLRSADWTAAQDALRAARAEVSVPSSKLPSYLPGVDLEGTPGRDLNRFLAGVAATESPAGHPVGAHATSGGRG